MKPIVVRPGKLWTLEISQECLLCYDQSQQRSGHVNWPQNHTLIKVCACGLVFSHLIGFSLVRQKDSWNASSVHSFPGCTVKANTHEKRGNVSKEMDLFTTKRKLGLLVQKIFKINHSLLYVLKNVFIDLFLLTNIGFWRLTFPFTVFYHL